MVANPTRHGNFVTYARLTPYWKSLQYSVHERTRHTSRTFGPPGARLRRAVSQPSPLRGVRYESTIRYMSMYMHMMYMHMYMYMHM